MYTWFNYHPIPFRLHFSLSQTTIECLLEQNAQLRNNMKNTATSVVSAVAAQPAQISALQPQPHNQVEKQQLPIVTSCCQI